MKGDFTNEHESSDLELVKLISLRHFPDVFSASNAGGGLAQSAQNQNLPERSYAACLRHPKSSNGFALDWAGICPSYNKRLSEKKW